MTRFVVVLAHVSEGTRVVVLGPFRSRERAEARAAVVRRLAATYDEPDGTLHVDVEPLASGSTSAQDAMDRLYGAIE